MNDVPGVHDPLTSRHLSVTPLPERVDKTSGRESIFTVKGLTAGEPGLSLSNRLSKIETPRDIPWESRLAAVSSSFPIRPALAFASRKIRRLKPPGFSWAGEAARELPLIGIAEELAAGGEVDAADVVVVYEQTKQLLRGNAGEVVSRLYSLVLATTELLSSTPEPIFGSRGYPRDLPTAIVECVGRLRSDDRRFANWANQAAHRDFDVMTAAGALEERKASVEAGDAGPFGELWPKELARSDEIEAAITDMGSDVADVHLLATTWHLDEVDRSLVLSAYMADSNSVQTVLDYLLELKERRGRDMPSVVAYGPGIEPSAADRLIEAGATYYPLASFGALLPNTDDELRQLLRLKSGMDRVGWEKTDKGWIFGDVRSTWSQSIIRRDRKTTRNRAVPASSPHERRSGSMRFSAQANQEVYDFVTESLQPPPQLPPAASDLTNQNKI